MKKRFKNLLQLSSVLTAVSCIAANPVLAAEDRQLTTVEELSEEANPMAQVTSVSQFSDVQTTDWAFQALQSLVERYGCIAGYPNGTYRGNRAMTRYEFAAGLNACLNRINELIATATRDLLTREDLITLQRLQSEFSAELATLRGRVDALEASTAQLEANQFSTTTKLKGRAIFNISNAFGDEQADINNNPNDNPDLDSNTTFTNRVRLELLSSFTGTDELQVRLNAGNITRYNRGPFLDGVTGTDMTRLSFDNVFGESDNDVGLDKLNYGFNLGKALRVKVDATNAELFKNVNTFNPNFEDSGTGSISRYGRFSPIYRQGAGGAGVTVTANPRGKIKLTGAYLARRPSDPGDPNGVFNGANSVFGQVDFEPSKSLNLGFTFARTYRNTGAGNRVNLFRSTGSSFANQPFGNVASTGNHYSVQANFRPASKISVGGWAGYSTMEALAGANEGAAAEVFYWAANLGIRDFGTKNSLLGIVFGQPPKVTDNDINAREDVDTSYHLEALYRLQLSDNVSVTPGLLVIFNPEHNNDNDTVYVGTLRTTFSF
ncbi:carbohydrate-selective porin [Rivularia sp. PCC 7116]|uniref:iron uptake porin n=1 Tax=Rivularia sp. PCC 7116 TaxID=373994 RepID=UPI00029EE95B|nr:iron uptake porin [Rivularia sp. PCC 7116]AFY53745.1 carbohydrate-selective porin [Rivularia sp. PCC 7116]